MSEAKAKPITLSQDIFHKARSKGEVLTASVLQSWTDRALDMENKLSCTAYRSHQMECEALRLQEVNTKLTDENIKLRSQVDELSRSTPECVTLKARITNLQEDLRIQKLETLAAHGLKRDADTAWQKEVDHLRSLMLPQPQTITAGGTARGCGGAGLSGTRATVLMVDDIDTARDTMKRALTTALNNGTWLSSELLVDAVLMQLFPYPGKQSNNLQEPAPRHVSDMSFEEVTRPVIEWLNEFKHPMHTVIIENDSAVLTQTECAYQTSDYLKD